MIGPVDIAFGFEDGGVVAGFPDDFEFVRTSHWRAPRVCGVWSECFRHDEAHADFLSAFVDNGVHDFLDDVHAEASGLDVVEVPAADGVRIDLLGFVFDDDAPGTPGLAWDQMEIQMGLSSWRS